MKYLLAVDLGTTTCRCVIARPDGTVVGEAYRESRLRHDRPGWAEADPAEWWRLTCEVIRSALDIARVAPESVLCVGLSGVMHAAVPVDEHAEPLALAMLWLDQRCAPQCHWMNQELGAVLAETIGPRRVTTTWTAPKLRWLVEHRPDVIRRTRSFLLPKDFIRLRLTGETATDPSDAGGTSLLDPRTGTWAWPIIEAIGLKRDQFPRIQPSHALAGVVTEAAAHATGLAPGTPVVTGGSDVRCTVIGANHFLPGRACLYMGTAAWVNVEPLDSQGGRVARSRFGSTSTTGASLRWLRDLLDGNVLVGPDSYRRLAEEALESSPGAKGLLFLPHLMGERAIDPNPAAKGVLFGVTLAHERKDLVRAVLEGSALLIRRILDHIECAPDVRLLLVGGCARGEAWPRVMADVTGRCIERPQIVEAGALGAIILAGVGSGLYRDPREGAATVVRMQPRIEPDLTTASRYARVYDAFCELEQRVAPLYGWADEL